MYSDDEIDSAVTAGVLSSAAANALRAHVESLRHSPNVDEEHFRLLSGFNDIFVIVASTLVFLAVAWIGNLLLKGLGSLFIAVVSWGLAEFFVRKRRMALPAVVFLLTFVGGIYFSMISWLGPLGSGFHLIGASAVAAMAAWFHWKRFNVPITIAACAGVVVLGVLALLGAAIGTVSLPALFRGQWLLAALFICGIVVFALALQWDMSDLTRKTRRSDVAFWLHLLAAPLLVHPVFTSLSNSQGGISYSHAAVILMLYMFIAVVSLWVDRRALMVSALGYVLYAFSALLKQQGMLQVNFAVTAFVVGIALLFLSAFWHSARARTLPWLPDSIAKRLPPLHP